MIGLRILVLQALIVFSSVSGAEQIGSVDTVFKLLGPDHKIVIEAFDDPKVEGITCHLSRAKTGGLSGAMGLAEDPTYPSVSCRQIGPIRIREEIEDGDEVFTKRTSLVFKELHVVRFFDRRRQVLVYLAYSDRLIEGSARSAISTVPIMAWRTADSPSQE